MIAWVVIDRTYSRQTPPSFFPRCHSYFGSHLLLIPEKIPLSFHTITNCKFPNAFVLIFIQNARRVLPPLGPASFNVPTFKSKRYRSCAAEIPTRSGRFNGFRAIAFLFKLLRTLLHATETQLVCFQMFPHSLPKTTRGGVGSRVSTRLNWLSPIPFAKIASLPAPCRQVAGQTRNHDE